MKTEVISKKKEKIYNYIINIITGAYFIGIGTMIILKLTGTITLEWKWIACVICLPIILIILMCVLLFVFGMYQVKKHKKLSKNFKEKWQ